MAATTPSSATAIRGSASLTRPRGSRSIYAAGTASGDASVGNDHFTGVNAVQGSMFDDTLSGSAGNETFTGLGGNDFIDGRGGFDTVSYNNIYLSTGGVSVDLAAGTATGDAIDRHRYAALDRGHPGNQCRRHLCGDRVRPARRPQCRQQRHLQRVRGIGRRRHHHRQRQHADRVLQCDRRGVTVDLAAGTRAAATRSVGNDTFTGVNAVAGSQFQRHHLPAPTIRTAQRQAFDGRGGNDVIDGHGGFDTRSLHTTTLRCTRASPLTWPPAR